MTEGYPTRKMLEEHEASHTGGIKCAEPLCSFSRIGFKNSAALKRHTNEFHTILKTTAKPAAVRRQFVRGGRTPNRRGRAQQFAREDELKAHSSPHPRKRCIQQRSEATDAKPEDSPIRLRTQNPAPANPKPPQFARDPYSPKIPQDDSRLEHVSINSHNQEHSNVVPDLLPLDSVISDHAFPSSKEWDYVNLAQTPIIVADPLAPLSPSSMVAEAPFYSPGIDTAHERDQEYFGEVNMYQRDFGMYQPGEQLSLRGYVSPKESFSPILRGDVNFSGKGSGTKRRHDDTGYPFVW